MATSRIMTLHIGKGRTIAQMLADSTGYGLNPEKTGQGEFVTAYACDRHTADAEFLLAKREYTQLTGRRQESDVILYQVRQSFKPGEITPEEANRVGYEFASRFLKGKHAFFVCTHIDKKHIHNHIYWNAVALDCKRQTTPRMDRHETIVTGRCETFRYCHIGGKGMTSAELKHRVKLQEWAARIQDCRSSGLSVRAWCRQEEINAATYYRWERELLALAETEPCSSVSAVRFAELPAPKRVPRNVAERSATLHIGNASLDIYPGCDTEQLKMLVELLRLC